MNFSGGSATGTASAVWTNPGRTLTGFGGNALSVQSINYTSIAAAASVILRPNPTQATFYSIAVKAAVTTGTILSLYDGSNSIQIVSIVPNGQQYFLVPATNTVYLRIQNVDVANAANYIAAVITLQQ